MNGSSAIFGVMKIFSQTQTGLMFSSIYESITMLDVMNLLNMIAEVVLTWKINALVGYQYV